MCKGALSNLAVGGTKKAAILESEVKGEQSDQAGEVLRSQIMGNYKSLVRPVILNDGIGHSCDSVLTPGLIQLSWRPACSLGKPKTQTHFGKHSAHPPTSTPNANGRAVISPEALSTNMCYLGPRDTG